MEDGRATGAAPPLMLAGIVGSGEVGVAVGVATFTTLASVASGDKAGVVRITSGNRVAVSSREDGKATCAGRGSGRADSGVGGGIGHWEDGRVRPDAVDKVREGGKGG